MSNKQCRYEIKVGKCAKLRIALTARVDNIKLRSFSENENFVVTIQGPHNYLSICGVTVNMEK